MFVFASEQILFPFPLEMLKAKQFDVTFRFSRAPRFVFKLMIHGATFCLGTFPLRMGNTFLDT